MNILKYILAYFASYTTRGKLKTSRQVVFYSYRILTLSNYKKQTNNQNTKKQTDHQLQESTLLFSGLRDMEEPIRL